MYFSFPSGHSAAAGMLLNIILMLRMPPDEPHSDCSVPHSRYLFEYSCEICIHSLASLTPLVHLFTDLFPWSSRRYSDWSDSCRRSPYSLSFFIARSSSHYHWYLCRSQSWYKLFYFVFDRFRIHDWIHCLSVLLQTPSHYQRVLLRHTTILLASRPL